MDSHLQKLFGVLAIVLAILFPVYWIDSIGLAIDDAEMAFANDMLALTGRDLLFLIIGVLEVAVYCGLSIHFRSQINGGWASKILLVMAGLVVIFHTSLIVDLLAEFGLWQPSENMLGLIVLAASIILGLFSFAMLALGVVLLAQFIHLPTLLKLFAVVAVVAAVAQISVVFAFANLLLFPLLMLIASFHFLLGETHVEVV